MRLRQIQAHQAQGRHLRPLRRRSHPQPRAPRAHGPHRTGRAGFPHLVLQVHALAHRPDAGHERPPAGARDLLRGLHRHRSRQHRRWNAASCSPKTELREAEDTYGDGSFRAGMGAEAHAGPAQTGRSGRTHRANSRRRLGHHPLQAEQARSSRSGSRSARASPPPNRVPSGWSRRCCR